ncbi:hypothetical protein HMPREF1554_00369 [Porphyromonas gingivalis F0569]|nr:hypothetical protein CS059_04690 [Porphyromonas gingivalis]ERJ70419.1 hypothetical protein HMPREF1554_00369 [Porphyromonas gingivalis F0569]ERJ82344.1 hypothetical protein HMPREF1988_01655 [Porphyromonas gingivalis F0185]OWR76137.1 hypothetical protein SJDPG5_01685 [Porphyromonas gingivalis SJD5]OWR79985.1 hypothetical protein SJDPG11_04065 [Porphyromonas gingivalis SJD11]
MSFSESLFMVSGPRIESKEVYPLDFLLLIVFLSTLSDNIVLSLFWMEYHQVYMCVNTSNAIALAVKHALNELLLSLRTGRIQSHSPMAVRSWKPEGKNRHRFV